MAVSARGYLTRGKQAGQLSAGTRSRARAGSTAQGAEMRAPYSLSCLFLLSLGTCCPPSEWPEPGHPGEGTPLKGSWQAVAEHWGGWRAGTKQRRSEELSTLLSIARGPRGAGKEAARLRRGRGEGPEPPPAAGEKRSGTLGNLAEELSSYNRIRGGFTFRFGR